MTGGKVRSGASSSERTAARTVRVGSQQQRALTIIADTEGGATAFEVGHALQMAPNQAATRLLELREKDWAAWRLPREGERRDVEGYAVRETTPGNTGRIHVITDTGAVALGLVSPVNLQPPVEGWVSVRQAEAEYKAAQTRQLAERRRCRICGQGMVAGQPAEWTAHGVCDPGQMAAPVPVRAAQRARKGGGGL